MLLDKNRLRVALRVLAQVNNHTHPVRSDVELLKEWVEPADRTAGANELACIVINTELERRRQDNLVNDSVGVALDKRTPKQQNKAPRHTD